MGELAVFQGFGFEEIDLLLRHEIAEIVGFLGYIVQVIYLH